MKVCVFVQNLYTLGGVQRVVSYMLNELIKNQDATVTIMMPRNVSNENPSLYKISEKIEVIDLCNYLEFDAKSLARFLLAINKRTAIFDNKWGQCLIEQLYVSRKSKQKITEYLKSRGFDVIIGVGHFYSILLAILKPELQSKIIGWQHNTFESYFQTRSINAYGLYRFAKRNYQKLDEVLVLTEADKIKFDCNFEIKSKVLYNPVYFPDSNREDYSNDRLLFLGRMTKKQKGIDYLLRVLLNIKKEKPDFSCYIVGDGKDKNWIINKVSQYDLRNNVEFFSTTNNVYKYYNLSGIMLQTSRWEGFGLTIVEAMSTGISVVAFSNNGPDEIINNGVNGIIVPKFDIDLFSDSVLKLLNDKDLRRKIGEEAKIRASDFSISSIYPVFLEYLKKAIW